MSQLRNRKRKINPPKDEWEIITYKTREEQLDGLLLNMQENMSIFFYEMKKTIKEHEITIEKSETKNKTPKR